MTPADHLRAQRRPQAAGERPRTALNPCRLTVADAQRERCNPTVANSIPQQT
jgi:hypothetical protein